MNTTNSVKETARILIFKKVVVEREISDAVIINSAMRGEGGGFCCPRQSPSPRRSVRAYWKVRRSIRRMK